MKSYHGTERNYGVLPSSLHDSLDAVEPSICGDLLYRPCTVTLKNGDVSDIVYVISASSYIKTWGVWPEDDTGKRSVPIEEVTSIEASLSRLPAQFANKLYEAGESGMGYTIFTVVFSDGTKQAYSAGNAIDFIRYPEGKCSADVANVLPHEGRSETPYGVPDYYWCLYSE